MTQLHPVDVVENRVAKAVGWLVSLPVAISLFGLMVWLIASLQWKMGAGFLLIPFAAAAVGIFINRAVQHRLTLRWKGAVYSRVAEPIVTISSALLRLGDSFQVTYQQQVLQSLEIKQFTIQLVRRTRKVYHRNVSGVKETIEKKRERVVQTSKQHGGHFLPEDTFHQEVTLTIPHDEMPTSQAGNRYEEWILRVHLAIGRGPVFVNEYPFQVIKSDIVR